MTRTTNRRRKKSNDIRGFHLHSYCLLSLSLSHFLSVANATVFNFLWLMQDRQQFICTIFIYKDYNKVLRTSNEVSFPRIQNYSVHGRIKMCIIRVPNLDRPVPIFKTKRSKMRSLTQSVSFLLFIFKFLKIMLYDRYKEVHSCLSRDE